ncbi:MAG: hypothetical protein MUO77_20970, partial [Anaerolineales bacterium]|nr:hypothetical protein [Anaerolineales bacterium]
MAQTDSNPDDDLDDLISKVKGRRSGGTRSALDSPQISGLKPSEILFLPREQQKLINYLSRQRYARFHEIQQVMEMDDSQTLNILSIFKDAGYVHEVLRDGEIFYRIKFADSASQINNNLPKELWNALSLDRVAFLRQLPLFKNLTKTDLGMISPRFKQEQYA